MSSIFPGRPEARLQAVSVGNWSGRQITVYISGLSVVILDGPQSVVQTLHIDTSLPLRAVSLDPDTGKIAVAAHDRIFVLQPSDPDADHDRLQWTVQCDAGLEDPTDRIETVSWGLDDELLVGGATLTLFNTITALEQVWMIRLANRVKFTQFSPDGSFFVTTGVYDRLLKVWRRIGTGLANQQFEFSYLPHPGPITAVSWRRPNGSDGNAKMVLYTLCTDNRLRIWAHSETDRSATMLHLWHEMDLISCLQPRSGVSTEQRYVCIVDSRDFLHAAEWAVQQAGNSDIEHQTMAHLAEVVALKPEVCLTFDGKGNMSAWGFCNIGSEIQTRFDVFNVAHIEGLEFNFEPASSQVDDVVRFYNFCSPKPGSAFTILVHHFSGRIDWFECRIDRILLSAPMERQLRLKASWTGHSTAIKKVVRTGSGRAAISRTADNDAMMWTLAGPSANSPVVSRSRIKIGRHVHRIAVLRDGDFAVFLHHESISLWDCREEEAKLVCNRPYEIEGKPLCLILIPEATAESGTVHMATISSTMKCRGWEIRLPPDEPEVIDFGLFDIGEGADLAYVLPVDPAGSVPDVPGVFDSSARDVAFSYTTTGVIKTWSARVNMDTRRLEWFNTATVETAMVNPSLASGTSIRKVVLVSADRTQLTIWSTRSAQLEYTETFADGEHVNDVDWSSTPDDQSILSVGFGHRVVVYAQLRYDYLDHGPAWAAIKEINTLDLSSSPIGDSVWLSGGRLLVGVGNQVIVDDNLVDTKRVDLASLRLVDRDRSHVDIYTLVRRLNGPLPVFHPQFLSQCILAGKFELAHMIVLRLGRALKDRQDGVVELTAADLSSVTVTPTEIWNSPAETLVPTKQPAARSFSIVDDDSDDDPEPTLVDEEIAGKIAGALQVVRIGPLSGREQLCLAGIVSCLGTLGTYARSLDGNACRYLLFAHQHALSRTGTWSDEGSEPASTSGSVAATWREITWAFHSGCQDTLVSLTKPASDGAMTWSHARKIGLFVWLQDPSAVRTAFETVARSEYVSDPDRNPVRCSLFYLALGKKSVLLQLWRVAYGIRERDATYKLLSNNFSEPRWKSAAERNAYALLSKRRYIYAAAFFLLAGNLADAVTVLLDRQRDVQLAIAVARVWESGFGPISRRIVASHVLPMAAETGSRWLAAWAFWVLDQRDNALRAITDQLPALVRLDSPPEIETRSYLSHDPALAVLYRHLRGKSLHALTGSVADACRGEGRFVLQTANLYARMGCDWLALDLVRNWPFLNLPREMYVQGHDGDGSAGAGGAVSPMSPAQARSLLRRRSSLVVNDLPDRMMVLSVTDKDGDDDRKPDGDKGSDKKPAPTMFQEPDPNSLLDAFGF